MRELKLIDLVRGTRVTWEWSGSSAVLANERHVRPVGRVITHQDLPAMASTLEVGIQADDDPSWVLDPRKMMAKGRKIFAAEVAAVSGLKP